MVINRLRVLPPPATKTESKPLPPPYSNIIAQSAIGQSSTQLTVSLPDNRPLHPARVDAY